MDDCTGQQERGRGGIYLVAILGMDGARGSHHEYGTQLRHIGVTEVERRRNTIGILLGNGSVPCSIGSRITRLTGDGHLIARLNDLTTDILQHEVGTYLFVGGNGTIRIRQYNLHLIRETGELFDDTIDISILCNKRLAIELLAVDGLTFIIGHKHGEAGEVAPASHKAMILPFPSVDTLEAGHVSSGIDEECLTLRMIVVERARDTEHAPLFGCGRPYFRFAFLGVELTHHNGNETVLIDLITLHRRVAGILSDVIGCIIDDALHHVAYGLHTAVDRHEARTLDVTVMVVAVGCSILRAVHIRPETTQDIANDKLTRFAIVQVEHELAGVVGLIDIDNLLHTALTGRVPTGTREHFNLVILDGGNR